MIVVFTVSSGIIPDISVSKSVVSTPLILPTSFTTTLSFTGTMLGITLGTALDVTSGAALLFDESSSGGIAYKFISFSPSSSDSSGASLYP